MKNKEKFHDEIFEIACSGSTIAIQNGKPVSCRTISCTTCGFNKNIGSGSCRGLRKEWCESEYVEPSVDWSKVPVDTPILVTRSPDVGWRKRHFAKVDEDGIVYAWIDGRTSFTKRGYNDCVIWQYAKLAEDERCNG